jgi:prevent-host-death family protein
VHFGELLDSVVHHLDIVYVERAGVPQAVVVPIDEWKRHQRGKDPWAEFAEIMAEHDTYMADAVRTGQVEDFDAVEQLRAGRGERDEQLLGGLLGRQHDHQAGPAASAS